MQAAGQSRGGSTLGQGHVPLPQIHLLLPDSRLKSSQYPAGGVTVLPWHSSWWGMARCQPATLLRSRPFSLTSTGLRVYRLTHYRVGNPINDRIQM